MIAGVSVNRHHIWCQLHHLPITPYKMPGGQKNDNLCLQNRTKGCRFFLDVPLAWSNGQTVNLVPRVFPDPPTGYAEIEQIRTSKTWTAPEDGYFKFIGLAKSGDGGYSAANRRGYGGGSGGSGGIVSSVFMLNQGDTVSLTINKDIVIVNGLETANAYQGKDGQIGKTSTNNSWTGSAGRGGSAGTANGGNLINQNGIAGNNGKESDPTSGDWNPSVFGGKSVSNSYAGYSTKSGQGADRNGMSQGAGTAAYVVVLRGNTNIPLDVQNARDITTNALAVTALAQEQTGILLGLA